MKNCPQCDDIPEIKVSKEGKYSICCEFCGFETVGFDTEYAASEAWHEVYDMIEMRSMILARLLAKESDDHIKNYCNVTSLTLIAEYLKVSYDRGLSWNEIKSRLYKQIKVTELSYDRLKRKIDSVRANPVGE